MSKVDRLIRKARTHAVATGHLVREHNAENDLYVSGTLTAGQLVVTGSTSMTTCTASSIAVSNYSTFSNDVTVNAALSVSGVLTSATSVLTSPTILEGATIYGTMNSDGVSCDSLQSTTTSSVSLDVSGASTLNTLVAQQINVGGSSVTSDEVSTVTCSANTVSVVDDLDVGGITTLNNLNVGGSLTSVGATLTTPTLIQPVITGNVDLAGDLTVDDIECDILECTTLNTSGVSTLDGNLFSNSNLFGNGGIVVRGLLLSNTLDYSGPSGNGGCMCWNSYAWDGTFYFINKQYGSKGGFRFLNVENDGTYSNIGFEVTRSGDCSTSGALTVGSLASTASVTASTLTVSSNSHLGDVVTGTLTSTSADFDSITSDSVISTDLTTTGLTCTTSSIGSLDVTGLATFNGVVTDDITCTQVSSSGAIICSSISVATNVITGTVSASTSIDAPAYTGASISLTGNVICTDIEAQDCTCTTLDSDNSSLGAADCTSLEAGEAILKTYTPYVWLSHTNDTVHNVNWHNLHSQVLILNQSDGVATLNLNVTSSYLGKDLYLESAVAGEHRIKYKFRLAGASASVNVLNYDGTYIPAEPYYITISPVKIYYTGFSQANPQFYLISR